MLKPANKQDIRLNSYKINQVIKNFNKEINKRFKNNKSIEQGFYKISQKGKYIMEEKDMMVMEYIEKYYHSEVTRNIKRIWNGQKIEKELEKKLRTWNKESRSCERYVLDVVSAWLGEDYLAIILMQSPYISNKYTVELNGTDDKRQFKGALECNRSPDLALINKDTKEVVYCEVMDDNSNFVKRNNIFDLRWGSFGNKYDDMVKLQEDKESQVNLAIFDVKNDGFIIFPINSADIVEYKHYNKSYNRHSVRLGINYKEYFKTIDNWKTA